MINILNRLTHKRFNDGLSVLVIGLGLYIIIMPWLPNITLWWGQLFDDSNGYVYRGELASGQVEDSNLQAAPEDNTLVIPAINLDEEILEGADLSVLNDGGVWRRPATSTPDKGGNTVIIGHRFSYSDPSTFYHLNKLNNGDRFAVWWQQEEYVYEVFEKKVVPATALEIEQNTEESIITLYTCTPLWTARDRLVVVAKLIEDDNL